MEIYFYVGVVLDTGFEPVTTTMSRWHSTTELTEL